MEKKLILVGQLNKFEIWNEVSWNAKEDEWMSGDQDDDLSEVSNLSF
jgi:MraZ protein